MKITFILIAFASAASLRSRKLVSNGTNSRVTFELAPGSTCAFPMPAPVGPASPCTGCTGVCQTVKGSLTVQSPGCTWISTTVTCLPSEITNAECKALTEGGLDSFQCKKFAAVLESQRQKKLRLTSCAGTCAGESTSPPVQAQCVPGTPNCLTVQTYLTPGCTGTAVTSEIASATGQCKALPIMPSLGKTTQFYSVGTCNADNTVSFSSLCTSCSNGVCSGAQVQVTNQRPGACGKITTHGVDLYYKLAGHCSSNKMEKFSPAGNMN